MANVLEAAIHMMQSLGDDKKPPLHVGEAMLCWAYLTMTNEANTYVMIGLNTTDDSELKHALEEAYKLCTSQMDRVKNFMMNEGVHLPPLSEPKPRSDPNAVPQGVKLTEDQLANGLSIKVASAVMECASGVSQSIRPDVGLMFTDFLQEHLVFGATLKEMMKKRGWIKQPPFYAPPGVPVQ